MLEDIKRFIEEQKSIIIEDRKRLGLCEEINLDQKETGTLDNCDNLLQNNNEKQSEILDSENKENLIINSCDLSPINKHKHLIPNQLDINSNEGIGKNKQTLIDTKSNYEYPLKLRWDEPKCAQMLRYGEYSPNNPQLRVTAAPYIGLGEYEQHRNLFLQKRKADYLRHIAKKNESVKTLSKGIIQNQCLTYATKAIQTDIQNIHVKLIQHDLSVEKELSFRSPQSQVMQNSRKSYRLDQRLTSAQNALLKPEMDKPKSILSNRRSGSPRERLMSDLQHSYAPTFMDGFSYQDRSEELERERIKRDVYQQELRMQIEEKRRLQAMRDEQDHREQELENRRLEQQLLRMQEEQMIEDQRRNRRDEHMRRHSDDLYRRKQELQSRGYRKHTDSESSVSNLRTTEVASKPLSSHYTDLCYSPPVSRRNPAYSFHVPSTSSVFSHEPSSARFGSSRMESYHRNRMESLTLNSYDYKPRNPFGRFDSLSRIDSLSHRIESMNIRDSLSDGQRRHSATQQDLRHSPKLQRRSSSSRFEDSLPIPVLKAHSPVAKELIYSVPFNSGRQSSDALRKLEDKWQIPAVQKNLVNHLEPSRDGQNRSILTQLGAIRMQLQQEQLRMDESLRKRGYSQSKAVDFH